MRWSERQRAMLREMGLRVWVPPMPARGRREPTADGADARRPSGRRRSRRPCRAAAPAARAPAPACRPGATDPRPAPPSPAAARPSRAGWRRRPAVDSPAPADWLVVGEPFVRRRRRSGRAVAEQELLLDNMLRAIRRRARRRAGPRREVPRLPPARSRRGDAGAIDGGDRGGAAALHPRPRPRRRRRRCSASTSRSASCAAACTSAAASRWS